MTVALADQLNLRLAWKRVKADNTHRAFIRHPFEFQLVEMDLKGWVDTLAYAIEQDQYAPGPMRICDVPKGQGTVRPGAHLTSKDRTVYAALAGASLPHIHSAISWSQATVDFAYPLSSDHDDVHWLASRFTSWREFDNQSLTLAQDNISHVIFTDITGYYENISLEVLMSDLRQTGTPESVVVQLSSMLNKWAVVPGRGLPQGHAPSDILAKLYLNSVDDTLRSLGIRHLRYVDDFRIFCRSEVDAKIAIMKLTEVLRYRGLSLQTAKTEILSVEQARNKVEGLTNVLRHVRDQFLELGGIFDPAGYIPLNEAEQRVEDLVEAESFDLSETPIIAIREAFERHFIGTDEQGFIVEGLEPVFNRALFHFLLNRLSNVGDSFARTYCLSILPERPEETEAILRYLAKIASISECDPEISAFVDSENAIYPYQNYQILEWRLKDESQLSEELLAVARKWAFDSSRPSYLRCICRALIGKHGMPADLERLQHGYPDAHGELEQCEIICCLRRMESRRRNAFFARVKGDGSLHHLAVDYAKQV